MRQIREAPGVVAHREETQKTISIYRDETQKTLSATNRHLLLFCIAMMVTLITLLIRTWP